MSKKHTARPDGIAYSTNKEFFNDFPDDEPVLTLPKDKQKLRVKVDTRNRAGKVVTQIEGFVGTLKDMEALAKELKTKCGAGGSVKDGFIIIQGDYRDKIIPWLRYLGYEWTR